LPGETGNQVAVFQVAPDGAKDLNLDQRAKPGSTSVDRRNLVARRSREPGCRLSGCARSAKDLNLDQRAKPGSTSVDRRNLVARRSREPG
jgi:hypothetical protein